MRLDMERGIRFIYFTFYRVKKTLLLLSYRKTFKSFLRKGKVGRRNFMGREFISEEEGQGTLEYILLIGGMVIAAVLIYFIYQKMGKSSFGNINESTAAATSAMSSKISAEAANMF